MKGEALMLRHISILICIILFFISSESNSQDISTEIISLPDLNTIDIFHDKFSLSPTGNYLGYLTDEQLCIYEFANEENSCVILPWEDDYASTFSNIAFMSLEWSYDEKNLAIAKYPFTNPTYDTDIWLYSIDSQEFLNLTDDNVIGRYNPLAPDSNMVVDFTPMWDALSQHIYFFRATPDNNGVLRVEGIYKASVQDSTIELVQSLPTNHTIFFGIADFSPDGNEIAMILADVEGSSSNNAIWVFNTETQEFSEVISLMQFDEQRDTGVDSWHFTEFTNLRWHDNDTILINPVGFQEASDSEQNQVLKQQIFSVQIRELSVQPLIFTLENDNEIVPTVVISIPQTDDLIAISSQGDNNKQIVYYGNTNENFILLDELSLVPHSNINNGQINQMAENGLVLVGGIIVRFSDVTE